MHTTISDGLLSPEEAAAVYKKAGYDFISFTDHWAQSEAKTTVDGLLMLSGCEWDTGDMINYPVYHIVGVGMEKPVSLKKTPSLPPQSIIDAINSAGGAAILAHPAWSVTDLAASMRLRGLSGAEVYNTVSGLPWNGQRADSSHYFDLWATGGKKINCMAADDSHFYNGEQTRSFIMVKASERSQDAIKSSILKGDFYASQGPRFDSVTVKDGQVKVACSPVEHIVFYSNTVWCSDRVAAGKTGTASYQIKPTDKYVRIELTDTNGNRAWCSPTIVQEGK